MSSKSVRIALFAVLALTQISFAQETPIVEAKNTCLTALAAMTTMVPINQPDTQDSECVIDTPVSLIALNSSTGTIAMPKAMANKCAFALQFTRWLTDVANPLAIHHLGSAIRSVQSGPGFVCRRRNNSPTGKLSEHAFGNAIDISGFTLESGDHFRVNLPDKLSPKESQFFAALRKTSCGYFNTVLGPGSNAAHATHLHLDMQIHGKTGNYKICE